MVALRDLSLDIRAGELFGFVGSNGAGKTTTMRVVVGVLTADAGEVRWRGKPITFNVRRRIGYTCIPVVFSSYQLELVERLCDRVGIIRSGELVACGTVDELRQTGGERLWVDAPQAPDAWWATLLAVILLLACASVMSWLTPRISANSVLRTGGRVKLGEALRS